MDTVRNDLHRQADELDAEAKDVAGKLEATSTRIDELFKQLVEKEESCEAFSRSTIDTQESIARLSFIDLPWLNQGHGDFCELLPRRASVLAEYSLTQAVIQDLEMKIEQARCQKETFAQATLSMVDLLNEASCSLMIQPLKEPTLLRGLVQNDDSAMRFVMETLSRIDNNTTHDELALADTETLLDDRLQQNDAEDERGLATKELSEQVIQSDTDVGRDALKRFEVEMRRDKQKWEAEQKTALNRVRELDYHLKRGTITKRSTQATSEELHRREHAAELKASIDHLVMELAQVSEEVRQLDESAVVMTDSRVNDRGSFEARRSDRLAALQDLMTFNRDLIEEKKSWTQTKSRLEGAAKAVFSSSSSVVRAQSSIATDSAVASSHTQPTQHERGASVSAKASSAPPPHPPRRPSVQPLGNSSVGGAKRS